jgi:hypothetical protein
MTSQLGPDPATSVQVRLDVGANDLTLASGDAEPFSVPFDADAFTAEYAAGSTRPGWLEAVGQALWRAAFSGLLGSALDQASAQAASSGTSVTLRVIPRPDTPSAVRWLPWELLFDPAGHDFLALKSSWSVVRGTSNGPKGRSFGTAPPRLLIVRFSRSDGQAYPGAAEEIDGITQAIGSAADISVPPPNPPEEVLRAMLTNEPFDIVHVIGSCNRDGLRIPESSPSSSTGPPIISSQAISTYLAANQHVGLVVLSACDAEWTAETIAETAGVAVLGHRQKVADHYAAALPGCFYPRLFEGLPADAALTKARRALDRRFPGERAWASAVLVTGWPPPALPASARSTDADEPAAEASKDARQLVETLYRSNADHARQLLGDVRWSPLEKQLRYAEDRLAEFREIGPV